MAYQNVVLKKQINGVITDLYPKTSVQNIIDLESQKALKTIISELIDSIGTKAADADFQDLKTKFNNLVQDAPEAYDTLVEISNYIASHKTEYEALLAVSGNKVDKEEGKGLSSNDFTDELLTKLTDLYTKADIDNKLSEINAKIDNIQSGGVELSAENVKYESGEDITNVKQALDQLLYVAPNVNTLTSSVASTVEIGSSFSDIVFNWTYNKEITSQKFNGVTLEPAVRTYTYAGPLTASKTFSLEGNDGTNAATKSVSINFQNYIHYGVSAETNVLNSEFVLGLSGKKFGTAKSSIGTITVNAAAGQYIYVAFPASFASSLTFKIGGFDTVFDSVGTFDHTNASGYTSSYRVFRSGQAGLGSTTMTVV